MRSPQTVIVKCRVVELRRDVAEVVRWLMATRHKIIDTARLRGDPSSRRIDGEEHMPEDVLMSVVRRAQTDREFRDSMLADPEETLRINGYALSEDEIAAVRDVHAELAGLSPDEVESRLTSAGPEAFGG